MGEHTAIPMTSRVHQQYNDGLFSVVAAEDALQQLKAVNLYAAELQLPDICGLERA